MRKIPTTAKITGMQNEDLFASLSRILHRKSYLVATQKILTPRKSPIFSSGNTICVDFYFEGKPAAPGGLAISAKYQEIGGTADEKVYYEVEWIIKQCCPVPCILLVRGEHWLSDRRERARKWLKDQIDYKQLKNVFFSADALYQWASDLPDCTGFVYKKNGTARQITLPDTNLEQKGLF